MASAKLDPAILIHLEWIGFIRPTGLVVSAPALVRAGAILDRQDTEGQQRLRSCVEERVFDPNEGGIPNVPDFRTFAGSVLGWSFSPKGYAGTADSPIPAELEVPLPDYEETLRPDFAVRELDPREGSVPWQLLVWVLDAGEDFDRVSRATGKLEASPHGRMERLLRQTGVPAGLLFNGRVVRLLSAPRGESSGWMDFRFAEMVQTAGRPILSAMRLLLGQSRLLSLPRHQRLAALLEESRKYQNEVSERLAEQVLHALYELLRGFQAAHDASGGDLLRRPLAEHPDEIYRSLLTVILRLIFILYAEERDMLPEDETYLRYYSLTSLYERLREDSALYPDTMDQRFCAWAQILVLFRLIHDGADVGSMRLPRRHGVLFDPDRFKFLEGRTGAGARQIHERITPPLVPDGTIFRALDKLLVLDGERISYRALDVEQIGSVYETMMGFRLETATGRSVAIRPQKKSGAPVAVDLEAALAEPAGKRGKWLQDCAGRKITDTVSKALSNSRNIEDLHAALLPVIDLAATPDLVPKGAMVLQPSEERRRSGSHYTPRALTEPIVRTTLEPILARLRGADGRPPQPDQILELKVCDPAMGSGAFLVETCRFLGDALIEAWKAHGVTPQIPPDEDVVVYARRLIAQRCLYGVDRNPVAVDLAKVSLWLVTLAKDHDLMFLDHALRHGDSLAGLSRRQIEALDWDPSKPVLKGLGIREPLDKATELRKAIREADENLSDGEKCDLWGRAQVELSKVRLYGNLVIAAFFESDKPKERIERLNEYKSALMGGKADEYRAWLEDLRTAEKPLVPFHWEIEFPEVFERERPGFDFIVGNPPFAGKNTNAVGNVSGYQDWLKCLHEDSHGNADLVAHFYRRAFNLIHKGGAFGLIATKTIAQGDTRATGLRWICQHGGEIYAARKRVKWPGMASVLVSIVHVLKGEYPDCRWLDGQEVDTITAFLFHRGNHDDPSRLKVNADKSFQGSIVLGMGFTFDDTDAKGVATSLAEMRRLIAKNPSNAERINPFIGYAEVANSPVQAHHRYVINFFDRSEKECRQRWPDLMDIIERKVRLERQAQNRKALRERWWQYAEKRPGLYAAIEGLNRVLVAGSQGSAHFAFAFLPTRVVYSSNLTVIVESTYSAFAAIQSQPHEIWSRMLMSTLGDSLAYTPTTCFETYPFPEVWENHICLETAGQDYYEFRAALMVQNDEGLTKTYNRFHDPDEHDPDILRLRGFHTTMDRAVLDAYGWQDIPTSCEFLLDYEIDEEEWGDKKKPWRYRWPDDVRDEVLARLLELNSERAKEEARSGSSSSGKTGEKRKAGRPAKPSLTKDLF